jgi:hypothetical protein
VTKAAFDEAVAALEDPAITVVAPMTVAAWDGARRDSFPRSE